MVCFAEVSFEFSGSRIIDLNLFNIIHKKPRFFDFMERYKQNLTFRRVGEEGSYYYLATNSKAFARILFISY